MKHQVSTVASRAGALVAGAALAAGLLTASGAAQAARSINAQSLSFSLTSSDDFVLTDTEFWAYDEAEARTYFSNLQVGAPVITCSHDPKNRPNCLPENQPTTPAAPPPIPQRLNPPVNNNKCTFFSGGQLLRVRDEFRDYKQALTVDLGTGNQRVTWRFEWTYQVRVIRDTNGEFPTVDPRTAWFLESMDPAAGVSITASGWLAGQSTQLQTGRNARFKTSHSLLDQFGAARLENAGISLKMTGANPMDPPIGVVEFGLPGFPNYSVLQNENFYYVTNAGTFGPGLLVLEGWVDDIQNGLVLADDGVTRDNFPGNDNQGGDRIVFGTEDPQNGEPLLLGFVDQPGSYTVTLFGSLKGNPGEIGAGFEATKTINVISDCPPPQ